MGMDPRYVLSVDEGRPGGDHTVQVVYDRHKGEIVSLRTLEPEPDAAAKAQAFADWAVENMHRMGIVDPERYLPNAAGVDNQGDAVIVEPPALPGKGEP